MAQCLWTMTFSSTAARITVLPIVLAVACSASVVHACSVGSSYRTPSTLELVDRADAIVIARVAVGPLDPSSGLRTAKLIPVNTLKGELKQAEISSEDAVIAGEGVNSVASDPRNLADPHPDTLTGGCHRTAFKPDMLVVAFLRRRGDGYVPDAPPFARSLEDVPGLNALWVKAVRMYVAVSRRSEGRRRRLMERLHEALAGDIHDPDSRLLAQDMARTLSSYQATLKSEQSSKDSGHP